MQNKIQVFENSEFGKLEVITIDGKPLLPAVECAEMLGYKKPHDAVSRHCAHSVKHGVVSQTTNQHGKTSNQVVGKIYIPEGDLYRLIIRSKLPAAEKFERWVFDEVLPSIRKHGAYISDNLLDGLIENPESAVNLFAKLKDEREQMAVLEGYVEIANPKVRYYDIILQCPGAVLVSVIAKDYGMTAVMFNKLLHELGIQFRYKTNRTWLLYKEYDNKGYTITKTYCKSNGSVSYIHMCWTQKGRRFLYDFLRSHGILPQVELIQSGFITAGS